MSVSARNPSIPAPARTKSVELRRFEYFIAVAEERHFGRAAERLWIAQPGLSQHIKSLERLVGAQLLTRDSHHVELTDAGQVFLAHARVAVEAAARAVESTRLAGSRKTGLLRVGTHVLGLPTFASDLLRDFETRFPDVQLETRPGLAAQTLEALTRRVIDVAFLPAPFEPIEGMRYLRLGGIEILVAVPEGHRLAALDRIPRSELLHEPFLDWPRRLNPTLIDHLHRQLFDGGEHPDSIEVPDVSDVIRLQLVLEGKGIAVVVPARIPERTPGIVFRRLEDPVPVLELALAWFDLHASPFVPRFVALARELLPQAASG